MWDVEDNFLMLEEIGDKKIIIFLEGKLYKKYLFFEKYCVFKELKCVLGSICKFYEV